MSFTLAGLGTALGGAANLYSAFQGPDNTPRPMSNRDFDQTQDQLDRANPREIRRQQHWYHNMDDTHAKYHNTFNDLTSRSDALRAKEQMDIMYEGTTPWERLGVKPPSQIQAPSGAGSTEGSKNATAVQASGIGASASAFAAESQKQAAAITALGNLGSSLGSAQIGAEASTDVAKIAARVGLERNDIETVKTALQDARLTAEIKNWKSQRANERYDLMTKSFQAVANTLPQESFKKFGVEITGIESEAWNKLYKEYRKNENLYDISILMPEIKQEGVVDRGLNLLQDVVDTAGSDIIGWLQSIVK